MVKFFAVLLASGVVGAAATAVLAPPSTPAIALSELPVAGQLPAGDVVLWWRGTVRSTWDVTAPGWYNGNLAQLPPEVVNGPEFSIWLRDIPSGLWYPVKNNGPPGSVPTGVNGAFMAVILKGKFIDQNGTPWEDPIVNSGFRYSFGRVGIGGWLIPRP